jgi:serine/threonine protein kinase
MIEAKILQGLNHPSIVRYVHSWGNSSDFYLATEFLNTKNMREVYQSCSPPRETLIEYMLQLLEVTEYLHYKGVVHRDIKPSNILLGDTSVLIDFDAAEAPFIDFEHERIVMGTPGYQCPESFKGDISPLGDIFSIGATLLFLLTCESPSGDFSRFRIRINDKDLFEIAFKAMDSKPYNRFRTAFEMKQKFLSVSNRRLELICGDKVLHVLKNQTTIGRGESADFRVCDPEKFISPIHAEITLVGRNVWLIDKASVNGTFIYRRGNYYKIDKCELLDGDVIALCYKQDRGPHKTIKFRNPVIY